MACLQFFRMPIIYHIFTLQKINHISTFSEEHNRKVVYTKLNHILDEIKQTNTFREKLAIQVKKRIIENNKKEKTQKLVALLFEIQQPHIANN